MARKKKEVQLHKILAFLRDRYHVSPSEVLALIDAKKKEKAAEDYAIPVSLFAASPLSSLEAITVYLREESGLKFSQMEKIVGRNQIVLSTTYRNARKKYRQQLTVPDSKETIPSYILKNKQLSVLENIVFYLKSKYHLHNSEIAKLLNKDPRTIWTVLYRIQKKAMKTKGKEVNK